MNTKPKREGAFIYSQLLSIIIKKQPFDLIFQCSTTFDKKNTLQVAMINLFVCFNTAPMSALWRSALLIACGVMSTILLRAQPFGQAEILGDFIAQDDGWHRLLDVYDFDGNGYKDVLYGTKAQDDSWFIPAINYQYDDMQWQAATFLDTLYPSDPTGTYDYFSQAYFFFERLDADGDGDEDLLTFNTENSSLLLIWFENLGTGFGNAAEFLLFDDELVSAHVADINNDGFRDLQITLYNGWLRCNGLPGGGFGPPMAVSYTCPDFDVYFEDLNNDGIEDYAHYLNGFLYIFTGSGNGAFNAGLTSVGINKDAYTGIHFADLTGDGFMDIIYESGDDVYFLHNQGNGYFGNDLSGDPLPVIGEISIDDTIGHGSYFDYADVDGDGDIDILGDALYLNTSELFFFWFENNGTGHFVPHAIETEANAVSAMFVDLNGDGAIDITLLGSENPTLYLHSNERLNGCTNPEACNFDPEAQFLDGTCCFSGCGCMSTWAVNYNPDATCDPGLCLFVQSGYVFHDTDEDGLWDLNENPVAGVTVHFYPAGITTITGIDGHYQAELPLGITQISCGTSNSFPYITTENNIDYLVLSNPEDISFGISEEMQIEQIECTITTPNNGYPCDVWTNHYLTVFNSGNVPVDVAGWVAPDVAFTGFQAISPVLTIIDGHYYFDTVSVAPGSSVSLQFQLLTPTAENAGIFLSIESGATGWYTPDVYATASHQISTELTCAYDPNDKFGWPEGWSDDQYVLAGQELEYRIRFQNTGNAPATDVIVRDTLDVLLDETSLDWIASSHPMTFSYYPANRAIEFRFENIMLPDSVNNEPESHGWIRYSILIPADASHNDEINNTAHIYFDNNAAVVTNTTVHRVFDCSTFNPEIIVDVNGTELSTVEGMSYQWFFNGMPLADSNTPNIAIVGDGEYCVSVNHPLGCVVSDLCEVVSGIQSAAKGVLQIQIQPTPDGSKFTVVSTEPLQNCALYDATGKLIGEKYCQGNRVIQFESPASEGLYIFHAKDVNNNMRSLKFIQIHSKR